MRLLNCLKCDDIQLITLRLRRCGCGASAAKTNRAGEVVYSGPSRVLGMYTQEYHSAVVGDSNTWWVVHPDHPKLAHDEVDSVRQRSLNLTPGVGVCV